MTKQVWKKQIRRLELYRLLIHSKHHIYACEWGMLLSLRWNNADMRAYLHRIFAKTSVRLTNWFLIDIAYMGRKKRKPFRTAGTICAYCSPADWNKRYHKLPNNNKISATMHSYFIRAPNCSPLRIRYKLIVLSTLLLAECNTIAAPNRCVHIKASTNPLELNR